MDERQKKRREVLTSLLTEAREELDSLADRPNWTSERLAAFDEFMSKCEFESALDVLQDIGGEFECSVLFWRSLKQAADVMGLKGNRQSYLRDEYRKAKKRKSAA